MSGFWSVCQTETFRERVAAHFLTLNGFQTYVPKIKIENRITCLFPGYVFVEIVDRWYIIEQTVGVIKLLLAGDHPARVRDGIVDAIKLRENNGVVQLPQKRWLRKGDYVRITRGSLADNFARFDGMAGKQRSRVLLEMLGRTCPVIVPKSDLELVYAVAA